MNADRAKTTGQCNVLIYRFVSDYLHNPDQFSHLFGRDIFDFVRERSRWVIHGTPHSVLGNQSDVCVAYRVSHLGSAAVPTGGSSGVRAVILAPIERPTSSAL